MKEVSKNSSIAILENKPAIWMAISLSSISFVLFHGWLPIPFMIFGFVVGTIFAILYHKIKNLCVPVYAHALWDATLLLVPMSSG